MYVLYYGLVPGKTVITACICATFRTVVSGPRKPRIPLDHALDLFQLIVESGEDGAFFLELLGGFGVCGLVETKRRSVNELGKGGELDEVTSLAASSSANLVSSLCNLAAAAFASSSPSLLPCFSQVVLLKASNQFAGPHCYLGRMDEPSSSVAVCTSLCCVFTPTACFCGPAFCFKISAC
jgi:hypothetical protein